MLTHTHTHTYKRRRVDGGVGEGEGVQWSDVRAYNPSQQIDEVTL
jgi:hypothetical protein